MAGRTTPLVVFFVLCVGGATIAAAFDALSLCNQNNWADGIHVHPTDCTKFIECSGRVAHEMDCPDNLVFNPNLLVCDDPLMVPSCDPRSSSPTTIAASTNTASSQSTTSSAFTVTTTQPTTTTKTTSTTTQTSTTTTTATTTTTTTPTTTSTSTTSTPTTTSTTTTTTTPTTTSTSTTTTPTTTSTTTTTTTPTTTTTQTTTPSTTGPTTTQDLSDFCRKHNLVNGIHPNPGNCEGFIECSFGTTYFMDCPAGLAFDSTSSACDATYNVDCTLNQNYIIG